MCNQCYWHLLLVFYFVGGLQRSGFLYDVCFCLCFSYDRSLYILPISRRLSLSLSTSPSLCLFLFTSISVTCSSITVIFLNIISQEGNRSYRHGAIFCHHDVVHIYDLFFRKKMFMFRGLLISTSTAICKTIINESKN